MIQHYGNEEIDMDDSNTNYLAHYGILGMQWGVRRYQNADGSLTSAGRKRYGEGPSKKGGSIKEKIGSRIEYTKKKRAAKAYSRKMSTVKGSVDEALNRMTDKRIAKETARYKAANDYLKAKEDLKKTIDSTNPKPEPKKDKLERLASSAGKVATLAENVARIKTSYDKIFGSSNSQSDSSKYSTELKRLQVIKQKKDLGIEADELEGYKLIGKSATDNIVKSKTANDLWKTTTELNKKIQSMN